MTNLPIFRLFWIVLFVVISAGCSSTKYSYPSPNSISRVSGHIVNSNLSDADIKKILYKQLSRWEGAPYKLGGMSKRGVDCSGFVHLTYKNKLGINIPRTTQLLSKVGSTINPSNLKPGDLVFFRPRNKLRHVGIYIGNGEFIHASSSKGVTKSKLNSPYWTRAYWKIQRIIQ